MQLQKATRKKSKLRLNISGPSGSGKTYSALLMAKGLVGSWSKIAVIDTEAGSASWYTHLGDYNTIDLQPPYSPERYIEAIDTCVNGGMDCIIIDSSSHEWSGTGGCIDINEKLAQTKFKGNTWSAWSVTTPRHDAFVNKVLQAPIHIITCTRSKMETVMGDDKKVKKVGMKDIQRENWEYELTVSLNLDRDSHMASPSKDRTELFEGKDPFIITEATGETLKKWCDTGIEAPPPVKQLPVLSDGQLSSLIDRIAKGEDVIGKAKENFAISELQLTQMEKMRHIFSSVSNADEKELNNLTKQLSYEMENDARVLSLFAKRQAEINVPA